MNRGTQATGHSEECRQRIQEELEKTGDVWIEREVARANRYSGELLEESEKKRIKGPEGPGGDQERDGQDGGEHQAPHDGRGDREQQPRAREDAGPDEVAQPEKRARQEEGGVPSSSCGPLMKEKVSNDQAQMDEGSEERGQKRGEDPWMEFAKGLQKRAKQSGGQGQGEGEVEMSVVDMVNWINAVLEEAPQEEEEETWASSGGGAGGRGEQVAGEGSR